MQRGTTLDQADVNSSLKLIGGMPQDATPRDTMTPGEPVAASHVGKRVAVGAAFMVAMRFAFRGLGLINTLILVRFLTPADFGLVGFATMAYSVVDQISDFSSGLQLIRMANPQRRHYDTAWTLGILRGAAMGALFAASAPLLAAFIREPRVELLSYVLAGMSVLQALENPGMVDLQRRLQFSRIFWCGVISKVFGTAVCIAIALMFRSYWALVAGTIGTRIVSLLLSYAVSPYRPRLDLSAWREMLNFSKWMLVINLQNMFSDYSTVFTVGRMNGAAAIGLYQVSYQIAALPVSELAAPVRQPIYAGYARVAHDRALLRRHFVDGLGLVLLAVAPACTGIALLAGPTTHLFLGDKWLVATNVVAFCSFYALFDSVAHFCQPLFFVLHHERRYVHLFTVVLAVRLPAMLVGAYFFNVEGAVFAMMVTAFLNLVLWLGWVAPLIDLRFSQFRRAVWRTVTATAAMSLVVFLAAARWPAPTAEASGLFRYILLCGLGAATQTVVQLALWIASGRPIGAEMTIVHAARGLLGRLPFLGPKLAGRVQAWRLAP